MPKRCCVSVYELYVINRAAFINVVSSFDSAKQRRESTFSSNNSRDNRLMIQNVNSTVSSFVLRFEVQYWTFFPDLFGTFIYIYSNRKIWLNVAFWRFYLQQKMNWKRIFSIVIIYRSFRNFVNEECKCKFEIEKLMNLLNSYLMGIWETREKKIWKSVLIFGKWQFRVIFLDVTIVEYPTRYWFYGGS